MSEYKTIFISAPVSFLNTKWNQYKHFYLINSNLKIGVFSTQYKLSYSYNVTCKGRGDSIAVKQIEPKLN